MNRSKVNISRTNLVRINMVLLLLLAVFGLTACLEDIEPDIDNIKDPPRGLYPPQPVAIGGMTYFVAETSASGAELWGTDGSLLDDNYLVRSGDNYDGRLSDSRR